MVERGKWSANRKGHEEILKGGKEKVMQTVSWCMMWRRKKGRFSTLGAPGDGTPAW
jgi:hypothetical protein